MKKKECIKKRKRRRSIPDKVKDKAVKLYYKKGMKKSAIARLLDVTPVSVHYWIKNNQSL